jgi:predicted enzyme related to lactoylglutathione lyase
MSLKDAPLFASLPAHDIERAKRWYEEKLELTPMLDMGAAGLIYRTAGSQWLIYQTPAAGTGKQTVGGFVVPDIDETMRDLRAKGVTYEDYAMGDEGPTTENGVARDPSGGASAWFKDSEGNILAVTQLPPGMSMSGDVA